MAKSIEKIIIIGSGNWGLALASVFSNCVPTKVWTIDSAMAEHINSNRENPGEFFKYPLPKSIIVEKKYGSSFDENQTLFIFAVPSSQIGVVAKELSEHSKSPLILSVSKGFDARHQCTMSQLIKHYIPKAVVIILTGPTIANEIAEGKLTRAVMASDDLMYLALVKEALQNDQIFFEISRNPIHHEVCAALKGLVAIAIGMADGLNLGANIQGVLMSEGIRELDAVSSFFGINENIALGTSGAGDLIATCISQDSRNRKLGNAMAEGLSLEDALKKVQMTVEGIAMSKTIETLWSLDVSIPLFHMVNGILLGRKKDIYAEICTIIKSL